MAKPEDRTPLAADDFRRVRAYLAPHAYWREREYAADLHAASLGQAEELADFLEVHALIHDHPVPFVCMNGTQVLTSAACWLMTRARRALSLTVAVAI